MVARLGVHGRATLNFDETFVWVKFEGTRIELRQKGTEVVLATWSGGDVEQALFNEELDADDWHGSAYRLWLRQYWGEA